MKNKKTIKPQKLAGFRDFFAQDIQLREYVINTFKKVFEKYGYEPLETPAIEPAEIFTSELGEEAKKLFYQFKDRAGRDVMLKYEVMVSMCRAVAENINTITFPYKRYQIQRVWRAEKPQKGRFREFTQCDADTIGSDSMICDAEFIQMGIEALGNLGFQKYKANISNRKLLNGIIKYAGADDKDLIPICINIDKLPKIGQEKVKKELLEKRKISPDVADKILNIVSQKGSTDELLQNLKVRLSQIPVAQEGLKELEQIFDYFNAVNLNQQHYQFAPFIARGLAYYTGPIWEFEILEGNVGSVAGCGRYDETIGRFVGQKVPATGGSFGIERIIEVIKDRKMFKSTATPTRVLVTLFNKQHLKQTLLAANTLRENNIATVLYPRPDNLDKQFKYADKKAIPYVIVLGPDEIIENKVSLKNMKTGEQKTVSIQNVVKIIRYPR